MSMPAWKKALLNKNTEADVGGDWKCKVCNQMSPPRAKQCTICSTRRPVDPKAPNNPVKKKWEVKSESDFSFDFQSDPHQDIENIDWSTATGVERSKGGSQGVYFVATPAGALVVKGSMGIGAEVFGSVLANRLGLKSPKNRIISMNTEAKDDTGEGYTCYQKLCELDQAQPINRTVHSALFKSFLEVMEFKRGRALGSLDQDTAEEFLGRATALSAKGRERLVALGHILAFDMLIHNTDRLPLVVENRGNAGNVMFSTAAGADFGEVLSIDNAVACVDPIQHIKLVSAYVQQCSDLLQFLEATPEEAGPHAKKVSAAIFEHTGFDIDGSKILPADEEGNKPVLGSVEVQKGISEMVKKIDTLTIEELEKMRSDIASMEVAGKPMVGLDGIRMDWLSMMLKLIKDRGLNGMSAEDFVNKYGVAPAPTA